VGDDLVTLSGRPPFWPSPADAAVAGWPSFGGMPVLLMPATDTVKAKTSPAAAEQSQAAADGITNGDEASWYAKLYEAYAATLSTNTTLVPIEGTHSFPSDRSEAAASQMLAKFAGV